MGIIMGRMVDLPHLKKNNLILKLSKIIKK